MAKVSPSEILPAEILPARNAPPPRVQGREANRRRHRLIEPTTKALCQTPPVYVIPPVRSCATFGRQVPAACHAEAGPPAACISCCPMSSRPPIPTSVGRQHHRVHRDSDATASQRPPANTLVRFDAVLTVLVLVLSWVAGLFCCDPPSNNPSKERGHEQRILSSHIPP